MTALWLSGVVVAGWGVALAPAAVADGPDYTFVVNSTADTSDQNPGDGNCYDNLLRCTLRAAIEEANALQNNTDDHLWVDVDFNIGGAGPHVISPATHFPASLSSIHLLATTQPGYSPGHPMIELDGSHADSLAGFYILGDASYVEGFDIHDFTVGVILDTLSGGIGFDTVSSNFIGTDVTGQSARGNNVGVYDSAPGSTIGGAGAAARNVISGNGDGVQVTSAGSGAWIIGNYIGTNASGTAALAPKSENGIINDYGWGAGVDINPGAGQVHVGGTDAGEGNVISLGTEGQPPTYDYQFGVDGVRIGSFAPDQPPAYQVSVQGNRIGTDASGSTALGNQVGVDLVRDSYQSTIGGTVPAARNVISGNRDYGVDDLSSGGTTVLGNYIGTDATGTSALGNGTGVRALDDTGMIGSSSVEYHAPNVISGNLHDGIELDGASVPLVADNIIGADASGQHLLGNGGDGIRTSGAQGTEVLDDTIAGNGGSGVDVTDSHGVTVFGGSIHDNGKLGIDLGGDGVTANDGADGDGVQNFPLISEIQQETDGTYTIAGSLMSRPQRTYRIQVYQSDACDPSGYGQGQRLVGAVTVTTGTTGEGDFTLAGVDHLADGGVLSATATGTLGGLGTSEFSPCAERTPPTVTVDKTDPVLLNAADTASTVTWHADRDGTLLVEVGGDSCGQGTAVETGSYAVSEGEHVTSIPAAALPEGESTVRVCLTDAFSNTGAATTTITKDSIPPTVTIDGIDPDVVNASTSSTALTWRADEAGTYVVESGGTACGSGTRVTSGNYPTAGTGETSTVPATSLVEGANTLRVCVTDAAGNTGSGTASVLKDTVAPAVTPDPALDSCDDPGNPGWCLHQYTAGFTVTDATSGVAAPCASGPGAACTFTRSTTTNGAAVTVGSGEVCDTAGNCATDSAEAGPYKIDSAAPTLSPALPDTIALDEHVVADPGASDPVVDGFASGIDTSSCGPVDTSTAGLHTLTCSAADVAGNTASTTVSYLVQYDVDGFFAPASMSKWRAGQTIPVKIALTDAHGVRIPDDEALALTESPCRVLFSAVGAQTEAPSCFRYDLAKHQFVFNWQLDGSATGTEAITATITYPGTTSTTRVSETIRIT